MPLQMSAYLKLVLRNLVFNKRKGKAGIKRKQTLQEFFKTKDQSQKEQQPGRSQS